MNDDGRWVAAGALGALGLAVALRDRVPRSLVVPRSWKHATPAMNARGIVKSGEIRPGRPEGADRLLQQRPERWLAQRLALQGTREEVERQLLPSFPGFTYFTTSQGVLEHHVSTDRQVFEGQLDPDRMWPDEDFIGPTVVSVLHNDVSYLRSVFLRYHEAPVSDVLGWGRRVVEQVPEVICVQARRVSMKMYGEHPFQIPIGQAILSMGLRDRGLGRVLRSGLPLTNIVAHRGPVPIVR